MAINLTISRNQFTPKLFPLLEDYSHRYEGYKGSAGSGKSYFITQKIVVRCCKEKIRVLVCRRYASTIRNTCFSLFKEVLEKWQLLPYVKIRETDFNIRFPNGSEIIFTGLDEETKLLSLANITTIFVEEVYEVAQETFEQLNLRLRGGVNQQILFAFNPISKNHWLYQFCVEKPPANFVFSETTYRDNPFLSAEYIQSLEELKYRNPRKYAIFALGEWGNDVEGLVFTNWKAENFDYLKLAESLEHRVGLDFGYIDPTAIVSSLYDKENKRIYVIDCFYRKGMQLDQVAEQIRQMNLAKSTIYCDSAEPRSIDYLKSQHFHAVPCIKGRDSVSARILFLQNHEIIILPHLKEIINEFENFAYKRDKDNQLKEGEYTHEFSHTIDALGYAYSNIYTKNKLRTMNKSVLGLQGGKRMFLLDKEQALTEDLLGKIIQQFQLKEIPKLNKYWNYYKGNQEIMRKVATDIGKPCNRIVSNYCYNITQNYQGYITGIPITYSSEKDFSAIQEVLNYNDVKNEDSELLRNALIFGRAFEINYIDEEGKQRFKVLDSRSCIPVYDTSLNNDLLYVIRFYQEDNIDDLLDKYVIEVYGNAEIRTYSSTSQFSSFSLLEERLHHYNQVPITVFSLNSEEESIFDKVITLQDAYNKLLSSEVDDFEAFCDAYMVLKGCIAEDEDVRSMKQNRVLVLDNDASAEYLTKSVNDTQIENMLQNINDTIHKIANSPDFNDEKLLAQSGIAMRYKLVGFENVASSIVANMTKALQRRIELICAIIHLTGGEEVWRDVDITFTRNLPVNITEAVQVVNQLRGVVSDKTLLTLLPFIDDADTEMEKIEEQKQKNMAMYNFGNEATEDDEEE